MISCATLLVIKRKFILMNNVNIQYILKIRKFDAGKVRGRVARPTRKIKSTRGFSLAKRDANQVTSLPLNSFESFLRTTLCNMKPGHPDTTIRFDQIVHRSSAAIWDY